MSLVIGFTNGEVAHVVSDGLVFSEKEIVAHDHRKFFPTPGGLIIGTAGFLRNCDAIERDFADSRLDFFSSVRALERRVASAYSDLSGYGLPLGILAVGHDGEQMRIANIAKEGAMLSTPGVPFVSYLAAGDAADDSLLRRFLRGVCAHQIEESRIRFMREVVRIFAERIPNQIGGEIFIASLPRPAMCPLNAQGAIVASPSDASSYTSTSSSITWSWSSFPVYFPDGSTGTVASGSQTFSGLSATTTYYFEMYVVKSSLTLTVVLSDQSGGTAPSSLQFQAQTVAGDGHIPVWIDRTGATVGGGSGGGAGGGGTCFSGDTKIETDSGFVRMDELPEGFNVSNLTGIHRAKLIVHTGSGEPMRVMPDSALVTEAHLFQREDGSWSPASEIFSEKAPSATRTVYDVHVITENPEDMHYILSNGYIAHNKKRVCFSGDTFVQTTDGWLPMPELPPEFKIINREGTFRARVVRHENCNDVMYRMPCGALVTGTHLVRPSGRSRWFLAADIFPKSTEALSTLFNILVDGSDHFVLSNGYDANDMEGML